MRVRSPRPATLLGKGQVEEIAGAAKEQGAGLLNARAAVEAAMTYRGSSGLPAGVKSNIITSTDQFTLSGLPGTTQSRTVAVTNVGRKKLTVATGTRTFSSFDGTGQNVSFDSKTLPTFPYPTTGAPWAYKKITFSVPSGTARLATQMAWQGSRSTGDAVVRVSLFAPDGTYVANSRPQGGAVSPNYANVDVRRPAAGTWTAVMYSPAGSAGYTGNVLFATTDQRAVPVGSVTPATFTLNPGQRRVVTFSYRLPSTASGDKSVAVMLSNQADIALIGPESAIYVQNSDSPVKIPIFCGLTSTDGFTLIGREEVDKFDWKTLKRKEILGFRPGSTPLLFLEAALRQNGLDPANRRQAYKQCRHPGARGFVASGAEPIRDLPRAGRLAARARGNVSCVYGSRGRARGRVGSPAPAGPMSTRGACI